uniref:Uncharacterized protein n=1 Tax=Oryza brachyantha TaxID=4533 RepID=J3LDG7_ORYBR
MTAQARTEDASNEEDVGHDINVDGDMDQAAIDVTDDVLREMTMVNDANKPSLRFGTVYPNMIDFRLAVRFLKKKKVGNEAFAIIAESELDLKATYTETTDKWTWFMSQLHKAIGNVSPLAICIDALGIWLNTYHGSKWYRSSFNPDIKCDYVTNNLAECFNNWIRDFKDLPICDLADKYRELVMILWNRRRRIAQKFSGRILPVVLHQLKARTRELDHLSVVDATSDIAKSWDNNSSNCRHVVKSGELYCICEE